MEWKWGAMKGGSDDGGQQKWIEWEHDQHWNGGWRASAPSSDRKRNPALIRPLPSVNWTRQLSCQVINSLRKFSALSQARLNTAIWIDKQSPVCTKCLLVSFVSQHPLPPLDNTPAQLSPPHSLPSSFAPVFPEWSPHSLSTPSFSFSCLFTSAHVHWSLCHFLNNDPGAEGTSAYLYFITSSPLLQAEVTKQERSTRGEGGRERRDRGGLAHSHGGNGGGCSSIMTDSSADVNIRAQSRHINDQTMATVQ